MWSDRIARTFFIRKCIQPTFYTSYHGCCSTANKNVKREWMFINRWIFSCILLVMHTLHPSIPIKILILFALFESSDTNNLDTQNSEAKASWVITMDCSITKRISPASNFERNEYLTTVSWYEELLRPPKGYANMRRIRQKVSTSFLCSGT